MKTIGKVRSHIIEEWNQHKREGTSIALMVKLEIVLITVLRLA
jgi:hypothetical protein